MDGNGWFIGKNGGGRCALNSLPFLCTHFTTLHRKYTEERKINSFAYFFSTSVILLVKKLVGCSAMTATVTMTRCVFLRLDGWIDEEEKPFALRPVTIFFSCLFAYVRMHVTWKRLKCEMDHKRKKCKLLLHKELDKFGNTNIWREKNFHIDIFFCLKK